MIVINRELRELGLVQNALPYTSATEALRVLNAGFAPLQASSQEKDKVYCQEAQESLSYLAEALELSQEWVRTKMPFDITNWHFLQTLTYCWDDPSFVPASASEHYKLRVGKERALLEDRGIRTLWRIGAIHTSLFKGQQHFSVWGFDVGRMRETLAESLANQGKVKGRYLGKMYSSQ